jgi:hypothetical protein
MKQTRLAFTGTAAVALMAWLLAVPASAQKVAGGGDGGSKGSSAPAPAPSAPSGGSSGGAVSSGSSGGGNTSSGGGYSGGGYTRGGRDNDGGSRRDGSTGSSGYAAPRGGGSKDSSGATGGYTGGTVATPAERGGGRKPFGEGTPKTGNPADGGVPAYSRPRDGGDPVGTAVPRGTTPRPPTGTTGIFIPGGYYGGYGYYDPWGYAGGYGYYGGYYDPWYGGYPTYPVGSSTSNDDEGSLRLKIKPREAEVYVDGYYVGIVDDFDGIFQRLHVETGSHRIEIRAPGYEPLTLDVRVTSDHTTTYRGELKKIQ